MADRNPKRTRVLCLNLILGLSLGLGTASLAQESMQVMQNAPGFKPAMTYQDFGKGESVNNFNGGLTVSHASSISLLQNLGASITPTRVYNAKNLADVYGFDSHDIGPMHGWLGMNWTLSFGRIQLRIVDMQSTAGTYYPRAQYFYIDESGAEHRLFLSCSNVTTPNCGMEDYTGANQVPTSGVWYLTNDSSYIRARYGDSGFAGKWRVFFPDGSTRILGGSGSGDYMATDPRPTGSGSYWDNNHYQQGWYTTQITDRTGNSITIAHYDYFKSSDPVGHPYAGAQPYMGAISDIQDNAFGRSIHFDVYTGQSEVSMLNGLLMSATLKVGGTTAVADDGRSITEYYNYGSFGYLGPRGNITCPELTSVTDVAGLQTLYSYDQFVVGSSLFGTVLDRIDYPTGATSTYHYNLWTYLYQSCPSGANSCEPQMAEMFGVDSHSEYVSNASGSDNTATWTWSRDFDNAGGCISDANINPSPILVISVVTIDPLGQQTAHFFSCEVAANDQFPPGLEMATFVYHQGMAFNRATPTANAVSRKSFMYKFRGGDADRCIAEYFVGGNPPAQYVLLGNSRVGKTVESVYTPGGTLLWWKAIKNDVWDGYGHYLLTETTSNQFTGTWIQARAYQIMVGGSGPYQLDRQTLSYTGTATSIVGTSPPDSTISNPPDPTSDITLSGGFKLIRNTYTDGPFSGAGLLGSRTQFRNSMPSFSVYLGGGSPSIADVTPGNYDPTATLTYQLVDKGNISSVAYSRGQAGNNYTANFYWQYGMVNRMNWSGFTSDELTRTIDQATSRIKSQTEANTQLTSSFNYDALGRLIEIIPPGGEYHTVIGYPSSMKSRSISGLSHSWMVGNQIKFFKGGGAIPPLSPPNPPSGLDPLALYSEYRFDDMGRLWKSDTLMPDNTWTERLNQYDPFGAMLFTSEPYSLNGAYRGTLNRSFPVINGSWTLTVPASFASGTPAYGTTFSYFSNANLNLSTPFTTDNYADDFRRVLWTIRADQSTVQNQYDVSNDVGGLKTSVTIAGTSTTTYTRDILGRLTNVAPPTGTSAAYTYDNIGNMTQANLNNQMRTFAYDALGHLTQAINPESGQVNYQQYDALGNLVTYQDANGASAQVPYLIQRTYDLKGRLKQVQKNPGAILATWAYDEAGHGAYSNNQLTSTSASREDGFGSVAESYTYDQMGGRLSSKTVTVNTTPVGSKSYTLSYSYDNQGQPLTEGFARGTDLVYTLLSAYGRGLLTSKKFAENNGVNSATYWPSGALNQVGLSNGTMETFGEDPAMPRVGSITLAAGSTNLWSTGTYTYDGMGNITAIGTSQSSPIYSYGSFSYDLLGRLTGATVSHVGATGTNYFPSYSYTYDLWGNMTKRDITNDGILVPAIGTTDAQALETQSDILPNLTMVGGVPNNRLTSVTRGQNSGGIITTFTANVTYDANGNVLSDGANTLTYDALNQTLQAVTSGTPMTEKYIFDASGERAAVVRFNSQSVIDSAAYFVRAGAQVMGEEQFGYVSGSLTSDRAKGYLYVGASMATTEIGDVAISYSISGRVTLSGSALSGVTVSTNTGFSATTDASGNFTIQGLASATYTVTPSKSGYSFSPASQQVTVSGANVTGINCTASSVPVTYSISGTISSGGMGLSGVTVSTTGASTTTSTSGAYTLTGLVNGTYTVTPSLYGYSFSPSYLSVTVSGANKTGQNFTANPTARYSISGQITVGGVALSTVTVSTNTGVSATTDLNGNFTLSGLPNATYSVTPLKSGYAFTPSYQSVTVSGANVTGKNFTGTPASTYTISGTVTLNGSPLNNVTVYVTGSSQVPTTTNSSGAWSMSGLVNATYAVLPAKGSYSFYPATQAVSINFANVTNVNFVAGWTIPVQVNLNSAGLAGVTIATTGRSTVTDTTGLAQLTGLSNGTYTVTPSKTGYTFSPTSYSVTISGGSSNLKTFTATWVGAMRGSAENEPGSRGAGEPGSEEAGAQGSGGARGPRGWNPEAPEAGNESAFTDMARPGDGGVYSPQEEPEVSHGTRIRPEALVGIAATYYAWDHLGSTRVVMDQVGNVLERHDFEPFGVELRPVQNQTGNTHWYTGQERDGNSADPGRTGLDYMHARFYGSNLARFMRPDPVPGKLSNPQSFNLYAYVRNNPVNWTDPTGLTVSLGNDWEKAKQAYDAAKKAAGGGAVYLHIAGDSKSGYTLVTNNAQGLAEGGNAGRALGEWIGSSKTLTLNIAEGVGTPGRTDPSGGGNQTISIDPAMLQEKNQKEGGIGGVLQTTRTALIHELGHAFYRLHEGFGGANFGYVGKPTLTPNIQWAGNEGSEEAYAMAFENSGRSSQNQRQYYDHLDDYSPAVPLPDLMTGLDTSGYLRYGQ